VLTDLLGQAGFGIKDIKRVIISHGHEDHDGNVLEVVNASGAELWAHFAFENMAAYHEDVHDGAAHPEFPGSCRTCLLPDQFNENAGPITAGAARSRLRTVLKTVEPSPDSRFRFCSRRGTRRIPCAQSSRTRSSSAATRCWHPFTPHPSLILSITAINAFFPGLRRK
jgi:hypothetical protein